MCLCLGELGGEGETTCASVWVSWEGGPCVPLSG